MKQTLCLRFDISHIWIEEGFWITVDDKYFRWGPMAGFVGDELTRWGVCSDEPTFTGFEDEVITVRSYVKRERVRITYSTELTRTFLLIYIGVT